VGDVVVQDSRRVIEERPVPRQQRAQPGGVSQCPQRIQRPEVVAEPAVLADHGRAPAQHGIPGEQGTVRRQQQAHRVGRVPGGGDHAQFAARRRQHVARHEALAAKPVRRVKRGDGRPAQLREPHRTAGMVIMPVRQHDLRHPPVAVLRRGQRSA
jgi:hypothetical protein